MNIHYAPSTVLGRDCTLVHRIFLYIQDESLKNETTVITYHTWTTLYSLQNKLAPISPFALNKHRQGNDYYSYFSDQGNEGRGILFFQGCTSNKWQIFCYPNPLPFYEVTNFLSHIGPKSLFLSSHLFHSHKTMQSSSILC